MRLFDLWCCARKNVGQNSKGNKTGETYYISNYGEIVENKFLNSISAMTLLPCMYDYTRESLPPLIQEGKELEMEIIAFHYSYPVA